MSGNKNSFPLEKKNHKLRDEFASPHGEKNTNLRVELPLHEEKNTKLRVEITSS